MQIRSAMRSGAAVVASGSLLAATLLGVAAAPAAAEDTPRLPIAEQQFNTDEPWIVSLGDSYISGEGGMEASKGYPGATPSSKWTFWNTAKPQSNQYYSGFTYGDKENYANQMATEIIDYCHRSGFSAIANLAVGYNYKNFACSGATAITEGTAPAYKPGVDFGTIGPVSGQAAQLQEFAQDKDVQVVVLSVGGNDLGFADIAKACVISYMGGFLLNPCSKGNVIGGGDVSQAASPESLARVTARVEGAINNIATAMRNAGRPDGSWKLVFQTVPLPIASSAEMAFADSGEQYGSRYARQNLGGCGIRDVDMDWIQTKVYPGLINSMRKAVERSKPALLSTPVVFEDNSLAFAGHKLCQKGVADTNVNFQGGVSDPLVDYPLVPWTDQVGKKTEWITPIIVSDQLGGDKHKATNALHPNYWGQRALSACLDIALLAEDNSEIKCTQDASKELDTEGRPAMTLVDEATPLDFTLAPAPTIVNIQTRGVTTSMEFEYQQLAGVAEVQGYEYSLDNGETWVAAEGTTSPLVIPDLVPGEPYMVGLRAVTEDGPGAASAFQPYSINGAPEPPTDVVATAKDYSVEVNFTPGDTGGWWDYDRYEYRIVAPKNEESGWETVPGGINPPLTIPDLNPEVNYTIEFRGVTFAGPSEAVSFNVTPGPRLPNFYHPVAPERMYDSRSQEASGDNEVGAFTGTRTIDLSKFVPAEATAIAYNATITGAAANGYLSVTPGGSGATDTSVVNFQAGETIPNAYIVQLGDGSTVDLSISGGPAQVVLDLLGYYTYDVSDSVYQPLDDPVRAFDSRDAEGPLAPGDSVEIDLAAALGEAMPAGANAVTFNLTSTGGQASGYLTIVPTGSLETGPISMVNWNAMSGTIANAGAVQVSEDGKVTVANGLTSRGATEFILDITGVYGPLLTMGEEASEFFPVVPQRAYDSRDEDGPLNMATSPRMNTVTGVGEGYQEVPADASAVAVNTTITGNTPTGYISLVPAEVATPTVSTVNWTLPMPITRANGSTVGVSLMGEEGQVSAFVGGKGQTEYILDLAGYFKRTPLSKPGAPTDVLAFPLDEGAKLDFTPPTDGGLQIQRYEYCEVIDGQDDCGPTSAGWKLLRGNRPPVSVIGLENGVEATLVLRAFNGLGAGPASEPVTVTPAALPAAPTGLTATPQDKAVILSFTAPADSAAVGAIVNYEYSTDGGQTWLAMNPATTETTFSVQARSDQNANMVNGEMYEFAVRAVNAVGPGAPSDAVESGPAGPPANPTNLKKGAVFGDRFATVEFTPSVTAQVAPIVKYQWKATSIPTGTPNAGEPLKDVWYDCAVLEGKTPQDSPCLLQGLRNNFYYSISLRAVNTVVSPSTGENLTSAGTVAVPLIQALAAPTVAISNLQGRWGSAQKAIEVWWTNPAQPVGTAAIANFEYTTDGGITWKLRSPASGSNASSSLPWRITTTSDGQPLAGGVTYDVTIRAVTVVSPVGTGPNSNTVSVAVPAS